MKAFLAAVLMFAAAIPLSAQGKTKCESRVNGYQIKTVYITGNHYNGVAWAYKHISEAACLTPVTDASKADAIIEVISAASAPTPSDSLSVSCNSSRGSSVCTDSDGNQMSVSCDDHGNCSSYYGPSLSGVALHAVGEWIRGAWYQSEVRIYTTDRKLIWKSDGNKGEHWYDMWPDKIREQFSNVHCKVPSGKGEDHFRKYASEKCNVEFDPLVSIDIKANARIAEKNGAAEAKQAEADEMKRNAEDAAKRQSTSPGN